MQDDLPSGTGSKRFVVLFLILLIILLISFAAMIRWAVVTLPQENEVIDTEQVSRLIEEGEIEQILIQEQRDVFLYLPDEPRPLYFQLQSGQTFTDAMSVHDLPPARFPPLTVEPD